MLHRLFGPFFLLLPPNFDICVFCFQNPPVYSGTISSSVKKLSFPSKLAPAVCYAPPILGWDGLDESVRNLQEAQRH